MNVLKQAASFVVVAVAAQGRSVVMREAAAVARVSADCW